MKADGRRVGTPGGSIAVRRFLLLRLGLDMSRPLLPSLVVATLAYAGHVVPRFMDDPALVRRGLELAWPRAPGAPPCVCGPRVMPRLDLRRQSSTAGDTACCNRRGDTP